MPDNVDELTTEQLENLIANYRRKGKSDDTYLRALAEHGKRIGKGLDFNTTMAVVKKAAREGRFVSYGEIAEASGADWNQVHYSVGNHMYALIEYCHHHGWPLLSAIVVNKPNVKTGAMEPETLKGFIAGARALGYVVSEPQSFLNEQQQRVFGWARAEL
ncbi:MAG TPA: hypothetical protein VHU18_00745 [Rhizomicrobium sp.]|jgi:hypothetical protein|nr:hypothetical protein [Rhizomicrobium sp.]